MLSRKTSIAANLLVCCLAAWSASASELYVFPSKGQSEAQTEQDKFSCYQWASKQTGYDPANPPPSRAASAAPAYKPGPNLLGGAAKGAIVAGIADGDAGKGAAIGALGSTIFGGMRHQREADAARQRQTASRSAKHSDYRRAYSACLEGKGYTVR